MEDAESCGVDFSDESGAWHIAEWDDVMWGLTEPPKPTIDLWRVAP
jgi:hypothetical protein